MVPPKSRVVWVLVALVLAAPAAQAAAGVEPLRPDEIGPFLDRVAAANRIYSQDMVAYQEYDVRLLIMHWHFTGRVLKTSDVAEVVLEGAPALFPKEISATLFEVADWLETFAIEYQGVESLDGHLYHRFYGTPLPGEESQTRWGTIWVDPKTFLINRIQVQYWWGRVTIQQVFRTEGEFVLLDHQQARVDPLGIQADVRWTEYHFLERQ